jgi:PilZ domain
VQGLKGIITKVKFDQSSHCWGHSGMFLAPKLRNHFRTPLDFAERRQSRLVCSFDAELQTEDGAREDVRVFNFSEAGFMLACRSRVNSGARVTLRLNDYGAFAARVLWCQANQVGGTFEEKIDADGLLRHLEERDLIAN